MRKFINNFYMKKIVLGLTVFGAIAGWIAWAIVCFTNNDIKLGVFAILFAVNSGSLFLAYYRGETSIQKLLFGSLFMFLIIDVIEILFVYIQYNSSFGPSYIVMTSIILLLVVVLFISHILQQSDHVGKSISSLIGQCLGLLIIAWFVFVIIMIASGKVSSSDITFAIGFMFTCGMLICMETRINKYKQIRTEALAKNEWNEEARKEAKKIFKF